jgi:hypothetical protein
LASVVSVWLSVLSGCTDTPPPSQLDGSFVIGDGAPPDARPVLDARPSDAAFTEDGAAAEDGARVDADDDLGDSGPHDAQRGDALPGLDADALDGALPDPCARTATITRTATAVVAEVVALDGLWVDVVATASIGPVNCTRRACPSDNPCCNTCTAELLLDGLFPLVPGACAARVGCSGDECNLVCSPPVLGFAQTFRGVVRSAPRPHLELVRTLP